MNLFKKCLDRLDQAINLFISLFLLAAIVSIGIQVFTRYILNFTPVWTEEAARYSNIWMTMLGIGIVLRRREHIRLDFLETVLPPSRMRKLDFFNTLVTGGFFAFLTYGGLTTLKASSRQLAPGLHISMLWIYIAIPLGGILAILFTLEYLKDLFQGREK